MEHVVHDTIDRLIVRVQKLLPHFSEASIYKSLSFNDSLPISYVMARSHKPWCYYDDLTNKLPIKWVLKHSDIKELKLELESFFTPTFDTTIGDVLQHPEIDWYIPHRYFHKSIRVCDVENNSHLNLMKRTYLRPNIVLLDIVRHPEFLWNFEHLSQNRSITVDEILAHPEFPWDYGYYMARNPSLTIRHIAEHPKHPWNYSEISAGIINLKDFDKYPTIPWNFESLSKNKHVTIQLLKLTRARPWNYQDVSLSAKITLDDVFANPNLPWNYYTLFYNSNINMKDIMRHCSFLPQLQKGAKLQLQIGFRWNYKYLLHAFINWLNNRVGRGHGFSVYKNEWSWDRISFKPESDVTWQMVKDHDVPWNFSGLSFSHEILLEEVLNNSSRNWDFDVVLKGTKIVDIGLCIRQYRAAVKIQRTYLQKCFYNPRHAPCRKRLELVWQNTNNEMQSYKIR